MGYDLVVSDKSRSTVLDFEELLPQEHAVLVERAAELQLRLLSQVPSYWGERREFNAKEVRDLDEEVASVEQALSIDPDLVSAVRKLRRIVDVARRHSRPLVIVPD